MNEFFSAYSTCYMCFLRDVIGSLDCNFVFCLARIKPFLPFFKGGSGGVTIM